MKKQKRKKNQKNYKKITIIKIEKKLINFTKRYFLNFKFVERNIATRIKQIKKKNEQIQNEKNDNQISKKKQIKKF